LELDTWRKQWLRVKAEGGDFRLPDINNFTEFSSVSLSAVDDAILNSLTDQWASIGSVLANACISFVQTLAKPVPGDIIVLKRLQKMIEKKQIQKQGGGKNDLLKIKVKLN
jgi:hypothetical protein